jgi:hypothetical protein
VPAFKIPIHISLFLFLCSSALGGDCAPSFLLNVVDRTATIRQDLQSADLEVEVDGKLAALSNLSVDTEPRRIVVLVDSSGSMEASPQRAGWGVALPAAAYAVDVIPANASAMLVTFSDKLVKQSSNFENREAVGKKVLALAKTPPGGPTSLFGSMNQILGDFPELKSGDAIFVVTDGADNKSETSIHVLSDKLASRGLRLFVFLASRKSFETEEEKSGAVEMEKLAERTGGKAVLMTDADISGKKRAQLDNLKPQLIALVKNVYRAELDPSLGKAKTVRAKISKAGDLNHNAEIYYQHEVPACAR